MQCAALGLTAPPPPSDPRLPPPGKVPPPRKPEGATVVTGGAGFIGSHVAEALLRAGHPVVVLDALDAHQYDPQYKRANVQELFDLALSLDVPFEVVEGDLANRIAVAEAFNAADAIAPKQFSSHNSYDAELNANKQDTTQFWNPCHRVAHLAARAGASESLAMPEEYVQSNVGGTAVLLDIACQRGVRDFVYASSSSLYGDMTNGTAFVETMAPEPISPYAATKLATEQLAAMYHRLHGIHTTGLRFFTVYGPRGRRDMAPFLFIDSIVRGRAIKRFGDGSSYRDYSYVSDIADGVMLALDKRAGTGLSVYNVGHGKATTLNEFIAVVENAAGKTAVITQGDERKGDVRGTFADIGKARAELGYAPKVRLADGLKRTVDAYRTERMQQHVIDSDGEDCEQSCKGA